MTPKKTPSNLICQECGSGFTSALRNRHNGRRTFCSRKCKNKFWSRTNDKKYWESSPQHKVYRSIRNGVRYGLKQRGVLKNSRVFELVTFTCEQLIRHLSQFFTKENGFNIENYGSKWELDHVVPQSWFNYSSTKDTGFQQCWSLDNLRPIGCTDNKVKNNRHIGFVDKNNQIRFA